jgi:hypothetical protein
MESKKTEVHYWNKIGDLEFDLTGSQYGGDGFHPLDEHQAHITSKISIPGMKIEFIEVESKEFREKITPSPWFEVLETRMSR